MTRPQVLARAMRSGPSRLFARAESTSAASASTSSGFEPALPAGQDPAYDHALAYLEGAKAKKLERLEALKAQAGAAPTPAQEQRIARMQVEAWLDDPATRREFAQTGGAGAMARPVMRALAKQAWQRAGELDLVMQRVFQLGIVPDVLPSVAPRGALRIAGVEAGSVLPAPALASPPKVTLQLFDSPPGTSVLADPATEALYTLLVLDADVPNHEAAAYEQRLLYAKADIPLSILSGETDLLTGPGTELLAYEPPAPAQGSGKHRYAFVAIAQAKGQAGAAERKLERASFDLRAFLAGAGLSADDVVAASLVRSEWTKQDDAYIADAWVKARGHPAPVYGKPPKELRYGYPLSAKAQRVADARAAAWDNAIGEMEALQDAQDAQQPTEPQQA